MGNFKVTGIKEAERMKKQYNLTVIGCHNNGFLQAKTYIFAESEEQVAKLVKATPAEIVEEPKEEVSAPKATFFKHRGRPKNK